MRNKAFLLLTNISLFSFLATIVGQISGQFLSATVGGSVLIPCSLPVHPLRLRWFYWQEDQSNNILFQVSTVDSLFQTKIKISSYQSAVNVSSVSTVVLSVTLTAPYQHLVLTVNNTANRATCTAHGGYPEPKVSWTGLNKSSTAQLDLQDAETSLQQDPTEKTFSVTSSVSMKEFQSVTCIIFNPRTNQRIKGTAEINDSGESSRSDTLIQ
uniref:Ig-like domain-containing protein n=1 Tax=Dicentrarchus labrax TaxID=13489 RepID=A0A8P4GDS4_DICLA